jgi:hypothetical protein
MVEVSADASGAAMLIQEKNKLGIKDYSRG